jgi:hypothetical protein
LLLRISTSELFKGRLCLRGAPTALVCLPVCHANTRLTEEHCAHLAPAASRNDAGGFPAIGSRSADGRFHQQSDDEFEKKPHDPREALG